MDAFDTLLDHAPDKLNVVKTVLKTLALHDNITIIDVVDSIII